MKIFKGSYRIVQKPNRLVVEYRPWYKFKWVNIGSERIDKEVITGIGKDRAFQVVNTQDTFNRAFNIALDMINAHKESLSKQKKKPCVIHQE